jgi:hypothetical protein
MRTGRILGVGSVSTPSLQIPSNDPVIARDDRAFVVELPLPDSKVDLLYLQEHLQRRQHTIRYYSSPNVQRFQKIR